MRDFRKIVLSVLSNLSTINIKKSETVENLTDYDGDSRGLSGSADALIKAINANDSDIVHIPKGEFLIDKSVTISENKKLVFSRNARLKFSSGTTITFNGSWEAGEDDFIFDLSMGGTFTGDYKVSEIRPEWFGAKGDGKTDDTAAFKHAMSACYKKRVLVLGAKTYRIRESLDNNARGIRGIAKYTDSANGGSTLLFDPFDTTTDLLPCLKITLGAYGGEFRDFTVMGKVEYNTRGLAQWVNKELYEQDKYEMFSTGFTGIEVSATATPTFRNIQTKNLKVGVLFNSNNGHITSYECNWNGLIGVYCRKNSGDYFFQGGSISGAFCGYMFGIVDEAGHYGGTDVTMIRNHMGFSPYSFYQVKDTDQYDSLSKVLGLNATFISTRFERTGEAVIKLLPKSVSDGITATGFGLSWSPIEYPEGVVGGWVSCMPDELLEKDQKQKYAMHFGEIGGKVNIYGIEQGGIFRSPYSLGALGSAYIELLDGSPNISGLNISDTNIKKKKGTSTINWATPFDIGSSLRTKHLNPVSAGNLMKSPEDITSWKLLGDGTGSLSMISDLSTLPIEFDSNVKKHIGEKAKVLKYTPDGTNSQIVALYPTSTPLTLDNSRDICYEYFVLSPKGTVRSRFTLSGGKYLYDESHKGANDKWMHIYGRGAKSDHIRQIEIMDLSVTEPSYIVGVMACYDELSPYSPYSHVYTPLSIETAEGLILTDTSTDVRYKLEVTNGALSVSSI